MSIRSSLPMLCLLCLCLNQLACKSTSAQSDTSGRSVLWVENARTTLDSNRLRYFFKQIIPNAKLDFSPIGAAQRIIDIPRDVRYTVSVGDITCFIREHQDNSDGSTPISAFKCLQISYSTEKKQERCIKSWVQTLYTDRFAEQENGESWLLCIDQEKNFPREFAKHSPDLCNGSLESLAREEEESCILHKLADLEYAIPKDNPVARNCQCGSDITSHLTKLKSEVVEALGKLSAKDLEQTCSGIAAPDGWDIHNLAFSEGDNNHENGLCGMSSTYCSSTVTVNRNCYFAGDVNYYLWGLANHYCYNSFNKPKYSLPTSLALVTAHRFITKVMTNSPMNIEGRTRWTRAGWDAFDEKNNYPIFSHQENNFPACELASRRLLKWHLNHVSSETAIQ